MVLNNWYREAFNRLFSNAFGADLNSTEVSVALLESSHTPDLANHASWDDVSADEVSGTNYTSGGQAITGFSVSLDTGRVFLDGDDVTWPDSTITAGYAVVYHSDPSTASDQDLLGLVDFEGEETSENGDFTIAWDANGIYEVNV